MENLDLNHLLGGLTTDKANIETMAQFYTNKQTDMYTQRERERERERLQITMPSKWAKSPTFCKCR